MKKLPPTADAAMQHLKRAYHQVSFLNRITIYECKYKKTKFMKRKHFRCDKLLFMAKLIPNLRFKSGGVMFFQRKSLDVGMKAFIWCPVRAMRTFAR